MGNEGGIWLLIALFALLAAGLILFTIALIIWRCIRFIWRSMHKPVEKPE
jgi:hypothetical protein